MALLTRRSSPALAVPHDDGGQVLLAEYAELKAEQRARIATRDGLLYAVLASAAAVIGFTATARNPALLLLIPPPCTILGWAYVVNDIMISTLGSYFAADLGPRLASLRPSAGYVFGWETAHRGRRHAMAKTGQAAVDLLAFTVLSAAAVTAALILAPRTAPLLAGAVVDAAFAVMLAARILAQLGTVLRTGR